MRERRYRVVDVTEELISKLDLFETFWRLGYQINLPPDAAIVDVHRDFMRQCWQLLLESKEFSPSHEGEPILKLDLVLKRRPTRTIWWTGRMFWKQLQESGRDKLSALVRKCRRFATSGRFTGW